MHSAYNIVISYYSEDNLPGPNGKGWVTMFSLYLKDALSRISSKKINIHFHSDLDTAHPQHYSPYTFVIFICSLSYLKTDLFHKELESLYMQERSANISERIFKIELKPIEINKYPEAIKRHLPYAFSSGLATNFLINDWDIDQSLTLLDLSYSIRSRAHKLFGNSLGSTLTGIKNVYLAQTGSDLLVYREVIQRELERQQINVFPSTILPAEFQELEKTIKKEMEVCELSIHLIGEEFGTVPQGSDRSIVDIQNKIALELSSVPFQTKGGINKQFSRLLWIFPELENVSEKQKIFIENVKRDTRALKEDEILQVPFDELREIIQNKISNSSASKISVVDPISGAVKKKGSIYMIHEPYDQNFSESIKDFLIGKGFEVISSVLETEKGDIRHTHQENLKNCDASLIICGKVNYEWINTKLQDLVKAPGFGRSKPFKAKALYITKEKYKEVHENLLNLEDSLILPGSEKFIPDSFFVFLNRFSD